MDGSASAFLLGIAENGFTFVVFGTVAFSLLMSILFLVTKGSDSLYDHIGQGGISREDDAPGAGGQQLDSAAARAEQEEEIRQMLGARNERLAAPRRAGSRHRRRSGPPAGRWRPGPRTTTRRSRKRCASW